MKQQEDSLAVNKMEHKTRDSMNQMLNECERRANNKLNACHWLCSKCALSNRYEKITGIRLEEIDYD